MNQNIEELKESNSGVRYLPFDDAQFHYIPLEYTCDFKRIIYLCSCSNNMRSWNTLVVRYQMSLMSQFMKVQFQFWMSNGNVFYRMGRSTTKNFAEWWEAGHREQSCSNTILKHTWKSSRNHVSQTEEDVC